MKLIIIIVGAVVLLGGGAAGAYFYFGKQAEAAAPEGEEHVEEAHAEKDDHGKEGDGHGLGYTEFVELDPLILPIVNNEGVSQVISMVVVLEVGDSTAATQVRAMSPRLKDAYIQDMYGMLSEHAALKGGVVQVSFIKARLNEISADVVGEDVVQDVLLQVVQQRPI